MSISEMSTRGLWERNTAAAGLGGAPAIETDPDLAMLTGRELMERTDTSPERRRQTASEQADRREAMRRSGTLDTLYPVSGRQVS